MFVKKDLRKIPRILVDGKRAIDEQKEDEYLRDLRLGRRQNELQGSVRILCQPNSEPALQHLETLSLYDCQISNLDGINMLESCPKLKTLNLGLNPLVSLPKEISQLPPSLTELLLDDCSLEGPLPQCIIDLENLEVLRMSNNQIDSIPADICLMSKLQVLALDRNQLTSIPAELQDLTDLKTLLLRHNQIEELPEEVPGSTLINLKLLHISSNRLTGFPDSLVDCVSLTHIYANGNQIKELPFGMERLTNLKRLNLGHNQIDYLPTDFRDAFGPPDKSPEAVCTGGKHPLHPHVILVGNPCVKAIKPEKNGEEEEDAEEDEDGTEPMEVEAINTAAGAVEPLAVA